MYTVSKQITQMSPLLKGQFHLETFEPYTFISRDHAPIPYSATIIFQTKYTKENLPKKIYQTKSIKPNLPDQI